MIGRSRLPAHSGLLRLLRAREDAAALGLLACLAAFLVVPALHLANHRADHDHGDGSHSHAPALRADAGGKAAPSSPRGPAPDHGHGSVEHLAAAIKASATFNFFGVDGPLSLQAAQEPRSVVIARLVAANASPRGPPAAA